MAKRARQSRDPAIVKLTEHLTTFVNSAFGRRLGILGPSRSLYDAVSSAIDDGYTKDECRIAFWVARCLPGNEWIKTELQATLPPEIVLRHCGNTNPVTGKPAVRWLDDLLARAGEINPTLAFAVWRGLPQEMREGEREILSQIGIEVYGE